MSRKTPTENLTRYLLGDLPEEERARLEDDFLGDEGLFERVADAENDLVDDYVGGRLAARERERFEQHYLRLPGSRERLQTARLIARERASQAAASAAAASTATAGDNAAHAHPAVVEPESTGFMESLRAFWRGAFPSMTPYAAGLAVLALAVGGLWWAVTRGVGDGRAPEVAETRPTPAPRATPEATPTPLDTRPDANANAPAPTPEPRRPGGRGDTRGTTTNTQRETRPAPTPAPARPRAESPTVTVLALVAGLTRGGGEANRLVVPKGAGAVRLEFPSGDAAAYRDVRASLRTVEGREVWGGVVGRPRAGRAASLTIPARLFANDDYLLILSGATPAGERVEFQEFYLNAEVR